MKKHFHLCCCSYRADSFYPADLTGTAASAWMLIPALTACWYWECEEVILFCRPEPWKKKKKEEEEDNLIDPSFGRERGTARCSVVSNPPESHLALFLLAAPPVLFAPAPLAPTGRPDRLEEMNVCRLASAARRGDSKTTSALLSNQLACGLSPSSSVSVSCIKLASESSLFGL